MAFISLWGARDINGQIHLVDWGGGREGAGVTGRLISEMKKGGRQD